MADKTTMSEAASACCYIDGRKCTGAFCDDCKKAQRENAREIAEAKSPAEVTAAHIVHKQKGA